MTAQTKIGGVSRVALLRLWFLFYVWAGVCCIFIPDERWRWCAWLMGSGLTCLLLYRRQQLAGLVGYVVAAIATVTTLPLTISVLGAFFSGRYNVTALTPFAESPLLFVLYYTALAFVPTAVLALHIASRHRLQRSFEDSVAQRRHGRIIPPSGYYLVTHR